MLAGATTTTTATTKPRAMLSSSSSAHVVDDGNENCGTERIVRPWWGRKRRRDEISRGGSRNGGGLGDGSGGDGGRRGEGTDCSHHPEDDGRGGTGGGSGGWFRAFGKGRQSAAPATDDEHDENVDAEDVEARPSQSDNISDADTDAYDEQLGIARHETQAIRKLKILLYGVLLVSALAVALGVYYYTSRSEAAQFHAAFHDASVKALGSVDQALARSFGVLDAFATDLVGHAQETEQQWPFVVFPNFAVRAEKLRAMSAAIQFSVHPLVEPYQRTEWEAFAWKRKGWINESMKVQETDPNYYGTINYDHKLLYTIHHDLFDIPYDTNRTMAPSWYNSPVETQTRSGGMNWDLLSVTRPQPILEAIHSRRPVLNEPYMLPDMTQPEEVAEFEAWKHFFRSYVAPGEDPGEPAFDIDWPILDRELDSVVAVDNYAADVPTNPKVVGIVMATIFWRDMIKDILPSGNNGTVLVFQNPCSPTFTYRIDGSRAVYLGRGDQHDRKYDGMVLSSRMVDLNHYSSQSSKRLYTGPPLNDEYCPYTIKAYPSATMERNYVSNNPIYFTVGVLLIFGFCATIFVLYDSAVERRQRKVMRAAIQSHKLMLKNAQGATTAERELNDYIAHEVRNPVAAAMTACSFIKRAVNEPVPLATEEARRNARDDVDVITNALNFVHDLLRNMLDIHRAANKDLVLTLTPTDLLRDVLEPVAAMLHQSRSKIAFLLDCPENLHIKTDRLRLKQIVLNMCRNSTKFVEDGFIRVRVAVVGGFVELAVEDSGPGIPDGKRSRLFSKFQQSLDSLSQGTGVGLYLCKNLTERLGGQLLLDETYASGVPGSPGARFVVKLNQRPVAPNDASNSTESESLDCVPSDEAEPICPTDQEQCPLATRTESARRLPQHCNVLFVDDDPVLRKLFVRQLRSVAPEWTVREAASGETALVLVEQHRFDLIFVDQYMASVERQLLGTETVEELRARGVDCRICGLSANDKADEFLSSGADAFCLKPFPCDKAAMTKELFRILRI